MTNKCQPADSTFFTQVTSNCKDEYINIQVSAPVCTRTRTRASFCGYVLTCLPARLIACLHDCVTDCYHRERHKYIWVEISTSDGVQWPYEGDRLNFHTLLSSQSIKYNDESPDKLFLFQYVLIISYISKFNEVWIY